MWLLLAWGWSDFRGLSRAVTDAPGPWVGAGFALMWLALLVLMPVSAVMGLMGLAGTALFGAVIGGLYAGVFTATESAAVGAIGAFAAAIWRGRLSRDRILSVMSEKTAITAMVYLLICGALTFSFFVGASQIPDMLTRWVGGLDLAPVLIVALLLVMYLLLGSVMDSFAVMIITVPIVTPLILGMGHDLVWWGILMLVVVETGLIPPPFGINLLLIRSVQPQVPLATVFRGALPFVLSDFLRLALLVLFPALVLWLPHSI